MHLTVLMSQGQSEEDAAWLHEHIDVQPGSFVKLSVHLCQLCKVSSSRMVNLVNDDLNWFYDGPK